MNMKRIICACAMVATLSLVSCGYHLGGIKPKAMKNMDTFCVNMFSNKTLQPMLSVQFTSALSDTLQRDGTYQIASPAKADFSVSGAVRSVTRSSARSDYRDSYLSKEIGLTVYVDYKVTNLKDGKVIISGTTSGYSSYFNDSDVSVQSAIDSALSYAARRAAENLVVSLTMP